jgi:Ca2+-binding EF-hand superfamily protein
MKSIIKNISAILIISFVCFLATESQALHELFRSLDMDKDGRVDRNEFSEDMKRNAFKKLDVDDNREITSSEWVSLDNVDELDKHSELFKRLDKDKDRRITFFEFSDYADKHSNIEEAFIGLDRDRNNSLAPDEITVRPLFRMITIYF